MIKIVFIKDSKLNIDEMLQLLETIPAVELLAVFSLKPETIFEITKLKPDIAMINGNLRETESLEIAARLQKIAPSIKLIYILNSEEYAVAAYAAGVNAYILEPCSRDKLLKSLFKLAKN